MENYATTVSASAVLPVLRYMASTGAVSLYYIHVFAWLLIGPGVKLVSNRSHIFCFLLFLVISLPLVATYTMSYLLVSSRFRTAARGTPKQLSFEQFRAGRSPPTHSAPPGDFSLLLPIYDFCIEGFSLTPRQAFYRSSGR